MNKKLFTFVVAAAFALFTVTSCNSKHKTSKERDDDDTEEVDEDEEEEEEETAKAYLSQDLATFDLYGQVLSVSYEQGEHTPPVSIQFSPDGSVVSILRVDGEGTAENASYEYNEEGRITMISWESDDPWVSILSYEGEGFVAPCSYTNTNQMGNYIQKAYHRDANGKLTSVDYEEAVHGGIVEDPDGHVFTLSDFDSHGNWLTCTDKNGQYTFVIKRTISYHGEAAASPEPTVSDAQIRQFITTMYNKSLYEDEDFLRENCTRKMLKKLADNYDYEGEGLACWLFRTSTNDGGGADNGIINVGREDDNNFWWRYEFNDGIYRGINRIKILVIDDKIWIDDVERVYDEAAEQ
jgi:hypothetical protein